MQTDMASLAWSQCQNQLRSELPEQQFNTWIRPLIAQQGLEDEVQLLAPNRFIEDWVKNKFIPRVQKRGAEIIKARGLSSAASAASAAIDHMRDWEIGNSENDWVSMAIPSDGSYGISEGIMFSYPAVCSGGDYCIVQNLDLDEFSLESIKASEKELLEEREAIKHLL